LHNRLRVVFGRINNNKTKTIDEAIANEGVVVFEHDPYHPTGRTAQYNFNYMALGILKYFLPRAKSMLDICKSLVI
ncbi:MAG: hypothetical protein JW920_11530, partial [Deltaproteobacteria bacterium]|nr:hypothetical protein [Deltaproteobacteria bacterium]